MRLFGGAFGTSLIVLAVGFWLKRVVVYLEGDVTGEPSPCPINSDKMSRGNVTREPSPCHIVLSE